MNAHNAAMLSLFTMANATHVGMKRRKTETSTRILTAEPVEKGSVFEKQEAADESDSP